MAKRKLRLRRGDHVRVVAGKDKGVEGEVLHVFHDTHRVVVEGVAISKRAQRPTQQNPQGGFREQESPIDASNVQIIDPQTEEPTRIGSKIRDDGRKVRVSVKTGMELDE